MLSQQEASQLGAAAPHLLASDVNISVAANLSLSTTREVLDAVYRRMAPLPVTALELLHRQRDRGFVTTPLPAINAALGGGLPPAIVELTGRAGVGKTQTCLSIVARACTPAGPGAPTRGAVYIDTEGTFEGRRFCEVAAAAFPDTYGTGAGAKGPENLRALLARVVVFRVETWQQLHNIVSQQLEGAVVSCDAALVVIDSLAAAARGDTWGKGSGGSGSVAGTAERAAALGLAASQLKALADSFGICVLVVNQVMANMSAASVGEGDEESKATEGRDGALSRAASTSMYSLNAALDEDLTPALGAAWLHFVNTRVFLSPQPGVPLGSGLGVMRLVKSPVADHLTAVPYRITGAGVTPVGAE